MNKKLRIPSRVWKIMKVTVHQLFLLIVCCGIAYAHTGKGQNILDKNISLQAENARFREILARIGEQAQVRFIYSSSAIDVRRRVSFNVSNKKLDFVLKELLYPLSIEYSVTGSRILLRNIIPESLKENNSNADKIEDSAAIPDRNVTGRVSDENGDALPGVSILLKGTPQGTTTNAEGRFNLNVPDDQAVLVFSFVGYMNQEIMVGNRTSFDVSLLVDQKALEEVVVVGYGTQKKVNVTGAVSSVSSKELENRPITNSTQALQGVTGIYVSQPGGQPGKDGATIRIRGQGTFNNNNPLVLVDGVEFPLADVNPNDIESISVLRDAASASIYGNRAANGVILVTTKSGSAGETRINYNNYFGFQSPTYLPETVKDPVRFMELRNQAAFNSGKTQPFYAQSVIDEYRNGTDPYIYPHNDWIDIMFNNAAIQEHNLRISGGTDKLGFSVSTGYLDQKGVLMGTDGGRFSVRSSLNYKYRDWLKLTTDLSFNQRSSHEPATTAASMMEMVFKAQGFHPAYLEDGRYADTWVRSPGHNVYRHPLVWANEGFLNTKRLNGILNVSAEITLPAGFKYLAKVGLSKLSTFEKRFVPNIYMYQAKTLAELRVDYYTPNKNRHVFNSNAEGLNTTVYNTLNYTRTIGRKNNISLLLGSSYEKFEDRSFTALIEGFLGNTLTELNAGSTNPAVTGSSGMNVLIGTFGRLNYDYENKYLLEANFRYDGSSRFAKGKQWGFFPSLSLGWRLDQEDFLKSQEWLSSLKLRGSYGVLGNQAIANFSYVNLIQTGREYLFGGNVNAGVAVESFRDPNISWETTRIANLGIDASLFRNQLELAIDLYDKRTDDILRPVTLPSQVGNLGGPVRNIGSVKNVGVDFNVIYRGKIGKFDYGINTGLNYNVNEVTNLNGEIIYSGDKFITKEGYPIDSYYILESDGLFQTQEQINASPFQNITTKPGYIKFVDQNNDNVINTDDRKIIGGVLPDITYNFGIDLSYRNFSLSTFFQGVRGINTYPEGIIATPFWFGTSVTERWVNESWTPDRPNAQLPIMTAFEDSQNDNFVKSDFWLLDASYLRLKNVQLGYTIPGGVLKKIGLNRCLVFVNGQNLLTLSKMKDFDPERNIKQANYYEYPSIKMYTAGINISF